MTETPPDAGAGCPQCWPDSPAAAWTLRTTLHRVAELVDDAHLGSAVLGCSRCGQQFISTFVEEVDWTDGDDPQYCSLMPLPEADAARISHLHGPAVATALVGLGYRSLRSDYPKGGPQRIYWGTGLALP